MMAQQRAEHVADRVFVVDDHHRTPELGTIRGL
jgi:hypothetical protein